MQQAGRDYHIICSKALPTKEQSSWNPDFPTLPPPSPGPWPQELHIHFPGQGLRQGDGQDDLSRTKHFGVDEMGRIHVQRGVSLGVI